MIKPKQTSHNYVILNGFRQEKQGEQEEMRKL